MPIRRQHVVPGAILVVSNTGITADTDGFYLDPHRMLYQNASPVQLQHGDLLHVITAPRRIEGINLVHVSRPVLGLRFALEGEVYYTDIIRRCSTRADFGRPAKPPKKTSSERAPVKPGAASPSRPTAWDRILGDD